jgi:hypothetical protein
MNNILRNSHRRRRLASLGATLLAHFGLLLALIFVVPNAQQSIAPSSALLSIGNAAGATAGQKPKPTEPSVELEEIIPDVLPVLLAQAAPEIINTNPVQSLPAHQPVRRIMTPAREPPILALALRARLSAFLYVRLNQRISATSAGLWHHWIKAYLAPRAAVASAFRCMSCTTAPSEI